MAPFSYYHECADADSLPELARKYLREFHHVFENGSMAHSMSQISYNISFSERLEDRKVYNTTTLMSIFRGQALAASFSSVYPERVPALQAAMEKSKLFIQQSDDALSPSSITLLFLPLFLNLIPPALISTISNKDKLLYIILTDIFSVVPFTIKGIELIMIGSAEHRSCVVRMSSSLNGTRSISTSAEMWAG